MGGDTGVVWFLRISEEEDRGLRVISVEGRVSRATAADLAAALTGPRSPGVRGVVVDLSGVDYINGAGLHVFETAAAQFGGLEAELVICGLRPAVRAVFDLAGVIPHLATEPSKEAALRRFERPGSVGTPLSGSG